MARGDARARLLDAAIDHIASRGISDLSLRELAAAIGTSHRMLIHHFGGREGLWVAVVRAVEERQRVALAELVIDPALGMEEGMRVWWRHISDPSLWPNERLFFELYGQALQDRPGARELLDGIVDAWVEPAAAALEAYGVAATASGRAARDRGHARPAARPARDRRSRRRRRGDGSAHRGGSVPGACRRRTPSIRC